MYDPRLIGTWRSDARRTSHEIAARRDIPAAKKSKLRRCAACLGNWNCVIRELIVAHNWVPLSGSVLIPLSRRMPSVLRLSA